MPVSYGSFVKQLKLLPLTLNADGSASLSVRFGYVGADKQFLQSSEQIFAFDSSQVSEILDQEPVQGMTRRDDLSFALYSYLVTNRIIEAGLIQ